MTYATTNPPKLVAQPIAGPRLWIYTSEDVSTDVDATGYFTNGYALGMRVGDVVHVIETDNSYAHTSHSVTVSTAGGASTIGAAT
jgi:hypothetical protein